MDGDGDLDTAATTFIRVISLSIAFYDYLLTLPAEWRFYRSQRSWRLSPGCILFIAIRYTSIAVMITSNVGYFGKFFTPESCQRYYIAPPVLKVLQVMVSQLILGIRTINISRRSTWVTWTIVLSFLSISAAEWFLNLWNRVPVQGLRGNCTAGNKPPVLTVWLFYVFAMVYDVIALGISTVYLIGFGPNNGKIARLVRIMLTDGLVYFVALTGVNILNLILYRSADEASQSSGVSLGYALTWIMSQRILIHLRDAAAAHNRSVTTQIVVSRPLVSALSVSQAMRSQFETKDRNQLSSAFDVDWSYTSDRHDATRSVPESKKKRASGSRSQSQTAVHESEAQRTRTTADGSREPERDLERGVSRREESISEEDEEDFELDVRVQVEEMVTVEYDPEAFATETYRTPRVLWGSGEESASVGSKSRTDDGRGSAQT
ncbi:hypothetical protein L227DRAFT_607179 [Lentinus tigrinus ALCF2SS1-6]|uniref:DUF6533 domain-containing protein n=1 Tax=Lentinus tigrinus ALCF2SS1-6 TaxID=1328759 RepID=A0A5C2SPJ4_9APHY|nr:hypothetical protein L227DRAFT_607179 [Lentinus tigrinus ALCF2SS1-6]